jgi:glycosyltransferase involved in cell wall biosynthesis
VIIHQFTPILEPGAVGAHTLLARQALRDAGHESEIFAAEVAPALAREGAHRVHAYRGGADVIVYQMAIGAVVADELVRRAEPLVVNYHNLTPVRYLTGWDDSAVQGVAWGRSQLRELARRGALGLAVSQYNEAELIDAGFARTAVVPVLFETSAPRLASPRPGRDNGGATWLFVGRIAAHKAQHDIVKAFAAYRAVHDPAARLHLVGGGVDSTYGRTLRRFVHELDLDEAMSMPGSVTPAELGAFYDAADVFVVCSDHEGFCVPLIEAMYHDVPIVAYAAAAIPETLGDAGLLLDTKDPWTVAAAAHRVVNDASVRQHLRNAGRARIHEFDLARTAPRFVDAVISVATR